MICIAGSVKPAEFRHNFTHLEFTPSLLIRRRKWSVNKSYGEFLWPPSGRPPPPRCCSDSEGTVRSPGDGQEGEEAFRCHGGAAGETTHVLAARPNATHIFSLAKNPSAPLLHSLLCFSVKPAAVCHSSSSFSPSVPSRANPSSVAFCKQK